MLWEVLLPVVEIPMLIIQKLCRRDKIQEQKKVEALRSSVWALVSY